MSLLMNMLGRSGMNVQQVMSQISQLQNSLRNPQALVRQYFSDVPQEFQNDPEQIVKYLIQNGRVTQQQIDYLSKMFPQK